MKAKRSNTQAKNWNWAHSACCRNKIPDYFRQIFPKLPLSAASKGYRETDLQPLSMALSIPLQVWMYYSSPPHTPHQLYRYQAIAISKLQKNRLTSCCFFALRTTSQLQWLSTILGKVLQGTVAKVKLDSSFSYCPHVCLTLSLWCYR